MIEQGPSFIQTEQRSGASQLLQVVEDGVVYGLHVLHAGTDQVRLQLPRRTRGHVHNVYHLVLYREGRGHIRLNHRLQPFVRGSLALSGPGDVHDFGAVDCRAVYSEVSFALRAAGTGEPLSLPFPAFLARITGTPVRDFTFPRQLDRRAATAMNDLMIELVDHLRRGGGFGPFRTAVCLTRLLALCADHCLEPADDAAPVPLTPLDVVRRYIQSNYTRSLTVAALAERAGMSRGHFLRQFKARFDTSPIAYQIQLRLQAARVLLQTTDLRCHEIAARVGYDDVYHFSRSFKQACGQSPTAFREGA